MAEPGDPSNPDDHDDDLIGFASPASLQGRARDAITGREPPSAAPPKLRPAFRPAVAQPAPLPPEPEADLFATPADAVHAAWGEPAPAAQAALAPEPSPEPAPRPVEAGTVFGRAAEGETRRRRRGGSDDLPGGGMGLYAVYALILFAVPTAGVSALIGLLAVTRVEPPREPLAASHFIYQQRTLWAAGIAAAAGLVLLALPFALGVPILFLLALWVVLRGASGVWLLKSGRPIVDPRSWWI